MFSCHGALARRLLSWPSTWRTEAAPQCRRRRLPSENVGGASAPPPPKASEFSYLIFFSGGRSTYAHGLERPIAIRSNLELDGLADERQVDSCTCHQISAAKISCSRERPIGVSSAKRRDELTKATVPTIVIACPTVRRLGASVDRGRSRPRRRYGVLQRPQARDGVA